jgi:hypothetical protein
MTERNRLLRHARVYIDVFIVGLVLSGVTAFPLETELRFTVRLCDHLGVVPAAVSVWLHRVYGALADENARYPFLAYGTDWLAFAHLVIAVAFVGPWRDPARNRWVLLFGLIACAGVPLLALIAGPVRGIPVYWRLIDCSFGVVGAMVLWPAYSIAGRLETAG